MSQLYGVDISEFQGQPDWNTLNSVSNFVIMRSCFGTARKDYQFDHNKAEAHRVQAQAGPLGIGYYHYAYPEYNSPVAEADFFVNNVSPLSSGDVLALDWEEPYVGDHVQWCLAFLQHVEARTGVKPLLYLNQSLMNSHNWSPVINNGNGLWLADYDGNQTGPGVNTPWPVTAVRQWTDADHVGGLTGNVDGDVFYGDFVAWNAYGYHPAPAPKPTTTTTTLPPTTTTTTSTSSSTTTTTTTTTLPPTPPAPSQSFWQRLWQLIRRLFGGRN